MIKLSGYKLVTILGGNYYIFQLFQNYCIIIDTNTLSFKKGVAKWSLHYFQLLKQSLYLR